MRQIGFLSVAFVAVVCTALLFPFPTSGERDKYRESQRPIEGSYIVVFDDSVIGRSAVLPEVESQARYLSGLYGGEVDSVYSSALKGFAARMTRKQAEQLSSDESVLFVEEDTLVSVSAQQIDAPWILDRIDQRSMPLDNTFSYGGDGTGVHVYVVDTGVRVSHVEFGGRASFAYDSVNDGRNGADCHGHGTHVAGTVGSSTYGVAKNAFIHNVRVLPCNGQGSLAQIIKGIDWVTANHVKPAVANVSITVDGTSPSTDLAVTNSVAAGVTYAIAAGNYNANACSYSPGRASSAITVGASGTDDSRASFSNYGSCVDIFAPGASVLSLSSADDTSVRYLSGTSMASPLVAGSAAVYLQANPTASPAAVWQAIQNASTSGVITNAGQGSPNRMLYSWLGDIPSPTPSPTVTPSPTPTPTPAPQLTGRITIRKRVHNAAGGSSSAAFPYTAVNLPTTSFTLADNQAFVDSNITTFGTQITVSEAPVAGFQLTDVSCVESSAGTLNLQNTTVDITSGTANIFVEEGESVDCTFTSQAFAPTASLASVSGRLSRPGGQGIKGVMVTLVNTATGERLYAKSNNFGFYSFADLEVASLYVINVQRSKKNFFASDTMSFMLNGDMAMVDFVSER